MTCAERRHRSALEFAQSDQSSLSRHEEPCTFSYPLSAQSSLGAQVILLFLSCNSSYDCHKANIKIFCFPLPNHIQLYLKEKGRLVGETFLYFRKRENEFQNMIKIYVSKPTEFL